MEIKRKKEFLDWTVLEIDINVSPDKHLFTWDTIINMIYIKVCSNLYNILYIFFYLNLLKNILLNKKIFVLFSIGELHGFNWIGKTK